VSDKVPTSNRKANSGIKNLTPIKKGQVLNPLGRPSLPPDLRKEAKKEAHKALRFWIDTMNDPNASMAYRLKASELVYKAGYGNFPQQVAMVGEVRKTTYNVDTSTMTKEQIEALFLVYTRGDTDDGDTVEIEAER
jgi:hypothetical protein